jgi:hypothetical protein
VNRENERERSVERLLRESLATSPSTPGTRSCLDAETLAAWLDGGLAGGQLTAAQEHVAGCGMCQATLAAVVRTTPIERGPERWWRRALGARWLVPVAATATALAIWVAVPRDEFVRPPEEPQTAARATAAPQTEASAPPTVAPAEKSATENFIAVPRPLEQSSTAALSGDRAQGAAAPDAREEQRDAAPPVLQRRDLEPKVDAPATPALESARERQEAAPASVGRAAAAAPAPAAPAPAQAGRFGTLRESVAVQSQTTIASPGTAFRWRIGARGSVEFSTDAGTTWELRPTGVEADLTAGAAPSGTVCWVVGRGGTVLLTTDGRQWRRLAFPVAADLNDVQAADARAATVTSVDGRRFRTVDGGATWESL